LNPKIIVAMANNMVIGNDNQMPWHIPEDLAWFKQKTMANTIIMGRKTFLTLGAALEGRKNVVLSTNREFSAPQIVVKHSLHDALSCFPDAFIIGGANVFAQALNLVHIMYITHIRADIPGNTRFPDFDFSQWEKSVLREETSSSGYLLSFCRYTKKPS